MVEIGCGCGRTASGKQVEFVVTNQIGEQRSFRTEIEARAYLARNGGKGAITRRELARR